MDIKLNYEEKGVGDVLILLHGNGEDHTNFGAQMEYFSKQYRVIALDTRGHGLSPRGDRPFTISQFADDLYDFMLEKDVKRANILGFSDGGNIALIFALRHPSLVDRLILNGANLFNEGCRKDVNKWIETEYLRAIEQGDVETAELMGLMLFEPNLSVKDLKKLKMPVLVIAGTHDMILRKHTRLIAKGITNSTLVFIEGNHFIAYKNPVAFNTAVDDFLKSTKNLSY
jgi:pimeloyl-ACP methyl ester carboxylesterase